MSESEQPSSEDADSETSDENRRFERHSSRFLIYVAIESSDETHKVDIADTFPAQTVDVSSGGLSFRWPVKFSAEEVTIVIPRKPAPMVITATVRHLSETPRGCVVGCQFLKKLEADVTGLDAAVSV